MDSAKPEAATDAATDADTDATTSRFYSCFMRDHLLQCFKKQQLTPFPHTILAKRRNQDAFPYHEIEVFCDCNMPEVYNDMVQCEECEEWFHMHCVGLKSPPPESETWQCSTPPYVQVHHTA